MFSCHHSLPLSHYSSRLPLANVSTVCPLSASCLNKVPLCWSHISGLHKEKLRLSRQLCAFGACRGLYNLICTISPLISCRAVVTNLNAAKINKRMQGVSVKACGQMFGCASGNVKACVCMCLCVGELHCSLQSIVGKNEEEFVQLSPRTSIRLYNSKYRGYC